MKTTVSMITLEPGYTPIPNELWYKGWGRYLPTPLYAIVCLLCMSVTDRLPKEEAIEMIYKYTLPFRDEDGDLFLNFNKSLPQFKTKEEANDYRDTYEREWKIKKIYEDSGFRYPVTLEDGIQLLIDFGIAFEYVKDGITYYDVILKPFPSPRDVLNLPHHELIVLSDIDR